MFARIPLAVPLAALGLFVVLLFVRGWAPLDAVDTGLSGDLRGYGGRNPGMVDAVRVLTDVAATVPFLLAGASAAAFFAARRDRVRALFCAVVTVLVPTIWSVMHWLLHSPRPVGGFVTVDSNGFPSGHTSNAAAAGLAAVLLLWPAASRPVRVAAVAAAVAFALVIGTTRMALLAHWPTDVLGGWLLALAVVPLAARAVTLRRPTLRRRA
jgi:membrane-associated phospholipid phosphatase